MIRTFIKAALAQLTPVGALVEAARNAQGRGEFDAAVNAWREVLNRQPEHAEALRSLGSLLARQGEFAEGTTLLERSIALMPGSAAAWTDLGNAYWLADRRNDAERAYRQAVAIDNNVAGAHMNLGLLCLDASRKDQALASFQRAYKTEPRRPEVLNHIVQLLIEGGRAEEALALCTEASAQGRDDDELRIALGRSLQKSYRPAEALLHYERALRNRGDDPELLNDVAIVLQDLGRLEDSATHYDRAIALKPAYRFARWHRSILRLLTGDFARGWDDYDLRLVSEDTPRRASGLPAWRGEDLTGRSVLVHGEQGLGDEIMFASCLPDVLARARAVALEVSPRLAGLMATSFPDATVFAGGGALSPTATAQRPEFEIPTGSLPALFRRSRADFPAHHGYLRADPAAVEAWRLRLAALGPGLKVGVSWQGGTLRTRQPLRSLQPADLAPVLQVPGTRCVNLQYGAAANDLGAFAASHGIPVAHWPEAIADFAQMAALICALDLVVSVCNTTIHLAGALGRPAWVLAPRVPEWRYGIAGEGMPWYPSVRIFRQSRAGEWKEVVARVATELARLPLPDVPAPNP